MRAFTRWAVLACAALWAVQAHAQTADGRTADDIVERYLAAVGGRAALTKLESRSAKGTIAVSAAGVDLVGSAEAYNKAPNKSRTYFRLDLSQMGAGEMIIDQRCDGKSVFLSNSMQGDRDITGSQLESILNNTFPTPLLNYKQADAKAELAGKDKVGDKPVDVVLFTPKAGPAVKEYFDSGTGLLLRTSVTIDVPELGGPMPTTTDLLDYREVDGVKVPFELRITNSAQAITVKLQSVEHNKPMDDAMFSRPAK